jgi:asparagine synthase (glutamine-hydrolysing)
MCGIAGFLKGTPQDGNEVNAALLKKMTDAIRQRGPDDAGYWMDASRGIALGHRRLSIVDLSVNGHQPMPSHSGRYFMAYNGEIYNHQALRTELQSAGMAPQWRGHSDTETLLAGFDAWGIEVTIKKAVGMFALAVWDRELNILLLARDRLGEKPLYYGWQGEGEKAAFLFGSELKALVAHPAFEKQIDRDALSLYLRHSYVPAPYSIYQGISKLQPGTILKLSPGSRRIETVQYWSLVESVVEGIANPYEGSADEAINELDLLMKDAVRQQMLADVPLGGFLSGGVDSSTIVALMQAQATRPVKTFTIGFHEAKYNEAEHASAVAKHLGTEHTELYVTAADAMKVIPRMPSLYDEPFSDSSQLPTLLVSQLAREHVTVSLSGDAGDELFSGYDRYTLASTLWRRLSLVPRPVRTLAAQFIVGVPTGSWNQLAGLGRGVLPAGLRNVNFGDKAHKGAALLNSASLSELYLRLVSLWNDPASVVIGAREPSTYLSSGLKGLENLDDMSRMMALDMLSYLPDDILAKVDRAAMGVSLETRVPLLDHRVVEFAWRLPQSLKRREGQSKWILKQVLYRYVPKELIERPKKGFAVPIADWLRGPLREWADELLSESRLRKDGYFHAVLIRKKWDEHQSGQRNWEHHLWNVLMFNMWADKWL